MILKMMIHSSDSTSFQFQVTPGQAPDSRKLQDSGPGIGPRVSVPGLLPQWLLRSQIQDGGQ